MAAARKNTVTPAGLAQAHLLRAAAQCDSKPLEALLGRRVLQFAAVASQGIPRGTARPCSHCGAFRTSEPDSETRKLPRRAVRRQLARQVAAQQRGRPVAGSGTISRWVSCDTCSTCGHTSKRLLQRPPGQPTQPAEKQAQHAPAQLQAAVQQLRPVQPVVPEEDNLPKVAAVAEVLAVRQSHTAAAPAVAAEVVVVQQTPAAAELEAAVVAVWQAPAPAAVAAKVIALQQTPAAAAAPAEVVTVQQTSAAAAAAAAAATAAAASDQGAMKMSASRRSAVAEEAPWVPAAALKATQAASMQQTGKGGPVARQSKRPRRQQEPAPMPSEESVSEEESDGDAAPSYEEAAADAAASRAAEPAGPEAAEPAGPEVSSGEGELERPAKQRRRLSWSDNLQDVKVIDRKRRPKLKRIVSWHRLARTWKPAVVDLRHLAGGFGGGK